MKVLSIYELLNDAPLTPVRKYLRTPESDARQYLGSEHEKDSEVPPLQLPPSAHNQLPETASSEQLTCAEIIITMNSLSNNSTTYSSDCDITPPRSTTPLSPVSSTMTHKRQLSIIPCSYPGCAKRFSSKANLKRHLMIHSGQKKYLCTLPGCMKKFARRDNLVVHRRNIHGIK